MKDGRTRKLKLPEGVEPVRDDVRSARFEEFLQRFEPKVVVISGRVAGQEIPLDRERLTLGRGPDVDVAFDDSTMSRQHAAIEYASAAFRIQDLGSTNGTVVNGRTVPESGLAHGDRFQLGGLQFQLVIDERDDEPDTYVLEVD